MGCSGHSDLVVAGCAHLYFAKEKTEFSRDEVLTEMRTASGYFKENMRKNLSRTITTLLKTNVLNEPRTGVYAYAKGDYWDKLK